MYLDGLVARERMTLPSTDRLPLMCVASLNRSPELRADCCFSDPAKSTRFSCDLRFVVKLPIVSFVSIFKKNMRVSALFPMRDVDDYKE